MSLDTVAMAKQAGAKEILQQKLILCVKSVGNAVYINLLFCVT
jgi:hypothetical protein